MAEDHDPLADTRPSDPAPSNIVPGSVLGDRWELVAPIDGGGMGTVWKATDRRLGEVVAVKLLHPAIAGTSTARVRFLREARSAALLRGPNVVSILDFDIDRRTRVPYMAMELLSGEDLRKRLLRGPLGYLETRSIISDICAAMIRAHKMGIIHRDLKPANVFLVSDDGTYCKVLDFGIAKHAAQDAIHGGLTSTGSTLGTLSYMSPEQLTNTKDVDHRSDLWSIALIAFECLAARPVFAGSSMPELVQQICFEELPIPSKLADVPAGFDTWFARAVRRNPNERYADAAALLEGFLSLKAGEITRKDRPNNAAPDGRPRAWASDANQIDIRALEEVTFKNARVSEFLEETSRYFVSGAKGSGKTLLLSYKRSLLGARYHHGSDTKPGAAGVQFVPEGRPYLDLMSDLRTVDRSHLEFMSHLGNTKRLWAFALRTSALSHHPSLGDPSKLTALPKGLRAMLEVGKVEPTIVVKEMLSTPIGSLNQVLDETETLLEFKIRSLHSGMFMFIDKIDQALRRVSRAAWINMQAGLVEAAWDLMNTNAHIKVYATIREEAFSSYASDLKANVYGATTTLRYEPRDLEQLLGRLTNFYEGIPLADFVSVDVVSSGTLEHQERAFDFLHRHTMGRPRDLVIIASEISRNRHHLNERVYKRVIYDASANILAANLFDEMRVFLDVLADPEPRTKFLSLIGSSILTADETIDITARYHGVDREYYKHIDSEADELGHPFRELYDCGLLGVIGEDEISGGQVMRFKQPHEPMQSRRQLPPSPVYILHPALVALARRLETRSSLRMMRGIVVGHGRPWTARDRLLADVQRVLYAASDGSRRDIEDATIEVLADFGRMLDEGTSMSEAKQKISKADSFSRLCVQLDAVGWDDLQLALLERFTTPIK